MEPPIKDYGLVGALMIGMFGLVAWILRSWASWMMKKIDEKNHFAERIVDEAMDKVARSQQSIAQAQEGLRGAIERLTEMIEQKVAR
ncbi:MAG: hypothetical protein H5T86_13280 [Armatimonadetes bacterium]|nr:hypothetical protein [Armatimonadota bacterium]